MGFVTTRPNFLTIEKLNCYAEKEKDRRVKKRKERMTVKRKNKQRKNTIESEQNEFYYSQYVDTLSFFKA